jgi:hypothetical protein
MKGYQNELIYALVARNSTKTRVKGPLKSTWHVVLPADASANSVGININKGDSE